MQCRGMTVFRRFFLVFLLSCGLALSMTIASSPAQADVKIEKVTYKGWRDAYKLSNSTVMLVYVPAVARIMHYGYAAGANVLWENKPLAGTVADSKATGNWRNVGGDKVWPWPQDDWGKLLPSAWPPPAAADALAHQVTVVGTTLRVTSPLVRPWNVRIIRDIKLDPTGTAVHITSRLVHEGAGESTPCAPWTITQVPAASWVMARLLPASTLPDGYKSFSGNDRFKAVAKTPEGALVVERNGAIATKIGMDADMVATLEGDTLFTIRFAPTVPTDNKGQTYVAGDRAQFYSQQDDENAAKLGTLPYIEMEMTAPLKTLKNGDTNTLSLVWELHKLPADKQNPAGVAATLKTL